MNEEKKIAEVNSSEMSKVCLQCNECCKWLGFIISTVGKNKDELREMYAWRGAEIKQMSDNQIFMIIPSVCKHLTQFGCNRYHTRPAWCRRYDGRTDPAMVDKCLLLKKEDV